MGKRVMGLASVAILVAIAANPALANGRGKLATTSRVIPIDQQRLLYDPPTAHLEATHVGPRADTTFFGGNAGAGGLATVGGVWDFEGGNLQGWSSIDLTNLSPFGEPPGVTFIRRQTDADFAGDPTNGIIDPVGGPDLIGSIWVGGHQDEAEAECWPGGQGYSNGWGVNARKTFTYGGSGSVTIQFDYYQDSEPGFDFTYVYSVNGGIRSAPYNTSANPNAQGFGYSGANELGSGIGSPTNPAHDTLTIPVTDLPGSGQPFDVLINFDSDPLYSDGLDSLGFFLNSFFGPFCFDNFSILGTGLSDTDNFEASLESWVLFSDPPIGTFVRARNLAVLDPVEDPCTCPITADPNNDFVMIAADETGAVFPHPKKQHEMIMSNPAYVATTTNQSIKVTIFDAWQDLPQANGVGYRAVLHYYPWTCPETSVVGWTLEPAGEGGFVFTSLGGAQCATFIADHSEFLPSSVESLKVVWELLGDCDDFGVTNCTGPEQTNQTPYWDNIKLGLSGIGVDAPTVSSDLAQYQDIGPTANSLVHTQTAQMVCFYDVKRADTNQNNALMGDSCTVLATSTAGRGTEVYLNLRVYPGPGINLTGAAWTSWVGALGENPLAPGWANARMDTAETVSGVSPGKYATYFWPNGSEARATSKILPDGLMTPGTTVEFFYTSRFNNSPPGDQFIFPDTTGKFFLEVEVLPSYRRSTAGGPVLAPCVLYVDAFNVGAQTIIEDRALKPRLGRQADAGGLVRNRWDRYDYLASSSNVPAPMAREAQGDNGITKYQSYVYRSILFNTGTFTGEALRNGDSDLLINWLVNTDFNRQNFQKGLWLSGNGIANVLDNPDRPISNQLLASFAATSLPSPDSYLELTGDSSTCVRLDAVTGRHFGTAGNYSSVFGSGCPSLLPFNVVAAIAGNGGQGNLSYVNQDGGGATTNFASVSNNKFTVGQGNWGVVLDAFSLHLMRTTPSGWTGSGGVDGLPCLADTASVGGSMLTRTTDVFAWFGVPSGSAILKDPASIIVGVDESEPVAGIRTALFQNTPNPFNPRTTVRYQIGTKSHVKLGIFDVSGRLVRTLVDDVQVAGPYSIAWDGSTDAGDAVSSGVYWARMSTADGFEASTKMVVLK
jgi:hypothetical protein